MDHSTVSDGSVRRLEIAGLYTLSFLGYIMHSVLHNLLAHGMDPKVIAETAEMMKQPSMQIMMFVFAVISVAPAFMAFVMKGKTGWRILAFLALVIVVLNGVHSIAHMARGDILNGGTTFVLQMAPGIVAVVWSFKFLRTFN
jgi:hypothetical protein